MPIAFITVDIVDKDEIDYMHFKCKAQKAWNCKNTDLFPLFRPGNRVKIDYSEGKVKPGMKYPPKYINNARIATGDDDPNTWPNKEPYNPSPKGGGGGGSKMRSPEETDSIQRQTAAKVAGEVLASMVRGSGTIADVTDAFPSIADVVYNWIVKKPDATFQGAGGESGDGAGSDGTDDPDADIKF